MLSFENIGGKYVVDTIDKKLIINLKIIFKYKHICSWTDEFEI